MKIAVIGLGRMGHAVAERLLGHHDLVLWNRTPEKGKDLLGERSTWASGPAGRCSGRRRRRDQHARRQRPARPAFWGGGTGVESSHRRHLG